MARYTNTPTVVLVPLEGGLAGEGYGKLALPATRCLVRHGRRLVRRRCWRKQG